MTPEQVKAMYRRFIGVGEEVIMRRYTGQGATRPRFDVRVMARVTDYSAAELVGSIEQGDRRVILLADDLIEAQFAIPIRSSDKVVVRGREMAILSPDDSTRRCSTVIIAYELQVRG
jgi:hypothetical protein